MSGMENGVVAGAQPTYAEAFPPLATPPTSRGAALQSAWPIKSIPRSTVTQIFHVPLEERRYQVDEGSFGPESRQGDIVRDIMGQTECDVEMSQSKDRGLTIMVSGRPLAVAQARRNILSKLQTQAHVDLKIPKEHHRFIIGRDGANLKRIELSTATKITVPKSSDTTSDIVRIMGTKDGVEKARHQVQRISDEQAKLAFECLEVAKEFHPFILGPHGSRTKAISEQTGARINVPPPSLMKNEITVAGDKEGVAQAVPMIKKIYTDMKRTCSTVSIEVRKSQHKYIVGQRWAALQDILEATGVWVEVPSLETEASTITLRGPQEKLGQALTMVYERANSVVVEEVEAPQWLHRFIIGRKGQNVQRITHDLPKVHVEFNSEIEKIILEGPPDQVTIAKESFESFTEDLMATMAFVEITVDQKYHRHIIGKGGSNVNRIKTETGTSIKIPPDEEKSDVIRIEGDPKGVAAAQSILLEMAAKMENERTKDLIIEHRLHRQMIGTKGEKIREIRDRFNGLQVTFPDSSEKKDIVTLRGAREDVEKCATHLKKLAAELTAASYREEVRVFKKFHGSIVGKGGATLRRIRDETDTKIELPTEKSDKDTIVIIGHKENVAKARAMIETIEREMASVTDDTVSIPHRLHNAIIGPKGRLLRSVMEECGGVRIHFPQDKHKDEVRLHGPREDVDKAKALLLEVAEEQAEENHVIEIRCKPEYHRFLIGRGGANIRKVRDEFDARVMFPQKGSDDDREVITIIGRKEAAEAARAHLVKTITDLDNIVEEEVVVKHKLQRHFVQRRGQLIHDISEDNGGVIISFPRAGVASDKVSLKGARQCIESARTRILEIVEELEAQVTVQCVIEQRHHRTVLGAKGCNVQAITHEYNVSVKFPDPKTPGANSSSPPSGGTEGEGEEEEEEEVNPRNLIVITGRLENAEAAKQALMELIPVSIEVDVPYKYHRFIIGQRGRDVRVLMDQCDVKITVPSHELQSDSIVVTGPRKNCEEARHALERRLQQLEAEKEERELRSFTTCIHVPIKYHPNIIGRKGATITKIRSEHGVRVQLPDKEGENSEEISIIGYEHAVRAAKDDILKIVRELEEQITDEMDIDRRVHSRLIGAKGKAIGKVMERYHVDIRFPRDKQSDTVTITGLEENVEEAKDHLLMLTDDYMQDVMQRDEDQAMLRQYTRHAHAPPSSDRLVTEKGYVVRDAPWSPQLEDFPAIGVGAAPTPVTQTSKKPAPKWGPSAYGPKIPKGI